jgi:hypothetical protein
LLQSEFGCGPPETPSISSDKRAPQIAIFQGRIGHSYLRPKSNLTLFARLLTRFQLLAWS